MKTFEHSFSFSRSDESLCDKHENWTYDHFKTCTVNQDNAFGLWPPLGTLGFQCGPKLCIGARYWCNDFQKIYHYNLLQENCPELQSSLVSERLCSNKTFWDKIPTCKRCSGNMPGQCSSVGRQLDRVKRAWSSENPCSRLNDLCKDKSQLVCDSNLDICSNSSMRLCADKSRCIHNDLFCDGYEQCPDGSDEDELICSTCPREFGYAKNNLSLATLPCRHRYTGKWICSVPCDGQDDLCLDFKDEDCDPVSKFLLALAVGGFFMMIVFLGEIFLKCNSIWESCDHELDDVKPTFESDLLLPSKERLTKGRSLEKSNCWNDFKQVFVYSIDSI